jgi:hypothetical protein
MSYYNRLSETWDAYEEGYRGLSYNRYDVYTEPEKHRAWDDGHDDRRREEESRRQEHEELNKVTRAAEQAAQERALYDRLY